MNKDQTIRVIPLLPTVARQQALMFNDALPGTQLIINGMVLCIQTRVEKKHEFNLARVENGADVVVGMRGGSK